MSKSTSGGTNVATVFLVVFVTLKLCGVIGWSWWWVTSPFWIPLSVAAFFAAIYGAIVIATGKT